MDIREHLEEYDFSFLRIKEETPLFILNNKIFTNSDYLYGRCHLFAMAYSKFTGKDIGVFISEIDKYATDFSEYDDNEGYEDEIINALDHAFCHTEYDSLVIDAKGLNYISELEEEYCSDSINHEILHNGKEIILNWIEQGKLVDFEAGEEEKLIHFIKNQFLKYGLNKNEVNENLLLEEMLKRIINNIKKEHPEYNFEDPKSMVNMCSYFNIKVMEALLNEGYESYSLLTEISDNQLKDDCILKKFRKNYYHNHNVVEFKNYIIDLTRAQFNNVIEHDLIEKEDFFLKFKLKTRTDSKKLSFK